MRVPLHLNSQHISPFVSDSPAYHWYKNAPTDEEFEEKLRQNYSQNIENSRVSAFSDEWSGGASFVVKTLALISYRCAIIPRRLTKYSMMNNECNSTAAG
jgi:hypothetical protein